MFNLDYDYCYSAIKRKVHLFDYYVGGSNSDENLNGVYFVTSKSNYFFFLQDYRYLFYISLLYLFFLCILSCIFLFFFLEDISFQKFSLSLSLSSTLTLYLSHSFLFFLSCLLKPVIIFLKFTLTNIIMIIIISK